MFFDLLALGSTNSKSMLHKTRLALQHSSFPRHLSGTCRMAAQRLANKTVFITGASSGIGKASAEEFVEQAKDGNIKLILAARRADTLETIADTLRSKGAKVHVLKLDVSRLDDIHRAIDSLPSEFKDVDILLNNAGFVLGTDRVGSIDSHEVETMFSVNVFGLIHTTQAILKGMLKRDTGSIINVGSIAGREAYAGGSIYCATKSAVSAFTTSLRKELISTRVRVMQVDPGQVETEFSVVRMRGDKAAADKIYEGVEPLTPRDIAEIVVFAAGRRDNVVLAETLVFHQAQAGAGAGSVHKRQAA